jgi:hypothetical protein
MIHYPIYNDQGKVTRTETVLYLHPDPETLPPIRVFKYLDNKVKKLKLKTPEGYRNFLIVLHDIDLDAKESDDHLRIVVPYYSTPCKISVITECSKRNMYMLPCKNRKGQKKDREYVVYGICSCGSCNQIDILKG